MAATPVSRGRQNVRPACSRSSAPSAACRRSETPVGAGRLEPELDGGQAEAESNRESWIEKKRHGAKRSVPLFQVAFSGWLARPEARANGVEQSSDLRTKREQRDKRRDGHAGQDQAVLDQPLALLSL